MNLSARTTVIFPQLKLTKLELESLGLSAQKRKIWTQINLQLTGKISLEFDLKNLHWTLFNQEDFREKIVFSYNVRLRAW